MAVRAVTVRCLALLSMCLATPAAVLAAVPIVAAEDVYAAVARQIAGPDASVTAVLHNPDQDPHTFEASASIAHGVGAARIVVVNGADYDPWMDRILGATRRPDRQVIDVAALLGRGLGDNPHLWFDPAAMPAFARALAIALDRADPAHAAAHATALATFLASLRPLDARVAALRARYAGVPVTATEPVFGLLGQAIGLAMRNERFGVAIMNGTEPRASDVRAFEADLRNHRVRLLIYNAQASDPAAARMRGIAQAAGIPVVGVNETLPEGVATYQAWVTATLDALEPALTPQPARR